MVVIANCTELRELLVDVSVSRDPRLNARARDEVMGALRELGGRELLLTRAPHPVEEAATALARALELVGVAMDDAQPGRELVVLGLAGRHLNAALGKIRIATLDDATGGTTAAFDWMSQDDLGSHDLLASTDVAELADIVTALATAVTGLAGAVRTVEAVVRRQGEQLDCVVGQLAERRW